MKSDIYGREIFWQIACCAVLQLSIFLGAAEYFDETDICNSDFPF